MSMLKKNRFTWLSRLVAILMFLTCLAVFAPLIMHFGHALNPVSKSAENGEIYLQKSDFLLDKKVALADGWRFFNSQLVQPQDVQTLLSQASFMRGTTGWQLHGQDGNQVNGFGTYFLKVYLPENKPELAIQIPQIESDRKSTRLNSSH